jgi:hypothetical protein
LTIGRPPQVMAAIGGKERGGKEAEFREHRNTADYNGQ